MIRKSIARNLPRTRAVPRRVRRETAGVLEDFRRLRNAGMIETLLFLRAIRPAVMAAGREAFRNGMPGQFLVPASEHLVRPHIRKLAEIQVATRVVARMQIREDAGLPTETSANGGRTQSIMAEALGKVSPERAVEYLRSLPVMTRAEWEAAIARQQTRAFFMSGVEQKVVLDQMRDLIAHSLDAGLTPQQFERQAFELLRNYEISPSRLRTVWNTNVAQALSDGRRRELADPEVAAVIPFGLFDAINDEVVRPGHELLDNGIAPMTWWNGAGADYYPPLEWNCRCIVLSLTGARARKLLAQDKPYFDLSEEIPAGATRRRLAA